jgi:hypothetical protein
MDKTETLTHKIQYEDKKSKRDTQKGKKIKPCTPTTTHKTKMMNNTDPIKKVQKKE